MATKATNSKRVARAPAAPKEELRKLTEAKLKGSALTEKDGKTMQIELVLAADCLKLGLPSATDGFLIPYFDIHGKTTDFFRVRYMHDTRKGFEVYSKKKAMRYGQVPGTINEAYLPPFIKWSEFASDPDKMLVITEGELKAACASKHGIPCMGLGGVWCFTSSKHGLPLLPVFSEFEWADRKVIICFDSDASTNLDIARAENILADRLGALGAEVYIARIPAEGDSKVGIDDYIVAHGPQQFMAEVLEKATAYAANAALHALNEEVVYIRNPGMVYSYKDERKMSPGDFTAHVYSNVWHTEFLVVTDEKGKTKQTTTKKQTAKLWLNWPYRAELKGITFSPGEGVITHDNKLNMWKGWGFTNPSPGDITPWRKLLDHVFGDEDHLRRWFEQWVAYPVQNPGAKQANAVMVWGIGEGTGKTMIGHTIMKLYGPHATELKDSDLEDTRNEWAENMQFALVDDVTGQDNRKLANRLKTMVTQKYVRLNPKFIPSYSVPDCINYYFTSNDPDALYLSNGDRRYMIHEVLAGKLPVELRDAVLRWRESEDGLNAFAHYLLNLDMTGYDPAMAPPDSDAKLEMVLSAKSDVGSWALQFASNADTILDRAGLKGDILSLQQLHTLYDPGNEKRASPRILSIELAKAGFARLGVVRVHGEAKRLIALRNPAKWLRASNDEITKHYEQHNPVLGGKKQAKF
jgi:putative DNA primase/helicase